MNQNFNFSPNAMGFEISNFICNDKLLVKIPALHILKSELRYVTQNLNNYKLLQSAKWSGELLLGVTKQNEIDSNYLLKNFLNNNLDTSYQFDKIYIEKYDKSTDVLMIARNLFDLREYKKCAYLLKDFINNSEYQSAIFLYYYSLFLAGEIRKEEEMIESGEGNSKMVINSELTIIERELEKFYKQGKLNEFNLYLYGLVLKEQERKKEAKNIFVNVLNIFPCFWSCWLELCKLMDPEEYNLIILEIHDHWMKNFFFSSFCLEKNKNNMCLEINYGLMCFFKNSNYLMNQIAHSFYNNQEYDISLEWFEKIVDMDPYRFENMDTYSNILYIKENQGELANLALRSFYNDKYSPETCCVIGNYYSLMGEHLKAVNYFRKALKLDRNCLAAWTLMGHEYLEMKNIGGAIEAYRNAVDIDPEDFRAWYGLGQTYELQNMNHYALYYFTKAVISRPKDSRMWNAMGSCYEKMDKKNEAAKCFERAESSKDKECIALHKLAQLYNSMGNEAKAVSCFEENLRRKDEEQILDKELGECLLYLSKYYKIKGNTEKALIYARRLYDFNGPERDEANSILYEINKNMGSNINQGNQSNF